jgi:hypothetical protein
MNGGRPALRGNDGLLIYMATTGSSETTLMYNLTTGLGSTFGSSAYFPDYFPDC